MIPGPRDRDDNVIHLRRPVPADDQREAGDRYTMVVPFAVRDGQAVDHRLIVGCDHALLNAGDPFGPDDVILDLTTDQLRDLLDACLSEWRRIDGSEL